MTTSLFSLENAPVRTAVRFPLHLDIVVSTQDREYSAVTVDVSSSGVLFEGDELPPVGASVAFLLKMPAAVMGGTEDVLLHFEGRIVRQTRTAGKSTAAAFIDNYTLKG